MNFSDANNVRHVVGTQWHFPIMTAAGFVPITRVAVGLVRSYKYQHKDGREVTVSTGVSSDYWTDDKTGETGYWSTLAAHVNK